MSDITDKDWALLAYRLKTLEGEVIDTSSTYVRLDLYLSERDALRTDVEAVKTLSLWTLGGLISAFLGATAIGIVNASGVF